MKLKWVQYYFEEIIMELFTRIFDSYVGILSLGVILFMLGMFVWFYKFFTKKIAEEDQARNNKH